MLQTSIFLAIRELFEDERFYLQDGAPPHYHRDVRAYLNGTLSGRWIGRRGATEYPPRSPDLTPFDFYLWGTLKNEVYRQKPATLNALRETIEASCTAITPDTLAAVVRSAVRLHRRCLAADSGHFEHIHRLSLCLSPRKNCNYMSLCSKDIDYQRVSTFFGPLCIVPIYGKIITRGTFKNYKPSSALHYPPQSLRGVPWD
ncbi:hypothetical protein B7P43_G00864 [Cryptotermes secundus]|uniref:Tc1-like transposase DDE domain-containing protein n=1 Tax=Cryptotermes secundus TaxID=105785 RepID=A0A2J7PKD1_9NEOP|nr:hypothetical protein B7P43_G00864 [Cryptotermes secundus]